MSHVGLVSIVAMLLGQATPDQQELPLGVAVTGQVDAGAEFAEYVFNAPGAGILTVAVPKDGGLSVITRGAGDVSLTVAVEGEDGFFRPVGATDSDQAGVGASESLVVDVESGQRVGIVVEAFDTSRYVIVTELAPRSDQLREMIAKALEGPPHPALDQPVPDLTFMTLQGEQVRLTDLRQRVIVLDIWATWCPPCVRALPQLQKVHEWATSAGHPVTVYAVNSREDPDTVKAFLGRHRLTMPVLLDQKGTADEPFRVDAIPTTVVIGDGAVRNVFVGYRADYAEHLQSVIESVLAP